MELYVTLRSTSIAMENQQFSRYSPGKMVTFHSPAAVAGGG